MTAPTAPAASAAKTRGRNYPAFGLSEAIQRARQLYDRDGKAIVSSDVAVQAWGYKGLNGASLRVLAAMRQYGLLDDAANRSVRLSNRALVLLLEPEDSPARAQAVRDAANQPAIFGELREHYGLDIPSDAALVSHLVRTESYSEEAANILIAAFRDTLALAEKAGGTNIARGASADPNATAGSSPEGPARAKNPASQGTGQMEFTWPLSGDAVATLSVTRTLEPDDIETLTAYFEIAKKALGKAAAARKPEPEAAAGGGETS